MKFFRSLKYAVTAAAVCLLCFSGRSEYVFAVSSIDIENDLNGDGAVDINDIELLSEFLLGKHTDAVVGADTNHDGDINVFDLIKLKRIINNSGGYTGFITADGRILKDENGKFVKTVYSEDFKNGNIFSFWSENNTGSGGKANIGYDDNASLCISGTTSDASFGRNNLLAVKGHSYKASGYFKVENAGQSAVVRPRVDVWSADEVSAFNKDFLEKSILNNIRFSIDNNVPVYCGEFGAGVNCFKNDRGGDRWVSDVIDVFIENDISFNYHTYHETGFGLYTDWNDLPTTLNEVLYELFKVKLTGIRSP